MKALYSRLIFLSVVLVLVVGIFNMVLADHDDHEGNGRHQYRERNHQSEDHDKRDISAVNHPAYTENCGKCHSAYSPGLLPSGSWDQILNGVTDHFGVTVELNTDLKTQISEYLKSNAAEISSGETSEKIMNSLGNQKPLRITEIPYIQKKHQDIGSDVLKRKAIRSLSNCSACHTGADQGVFDDDQVEIPN
jgi:hypothetical protein